VATHEREVAFITGAARGQGRAIAVRAAREGCDVIALDVCRQVETADGYPPATPDGLAETATLVEKAGRRVLPLIADVRNPADMEDAAQQGVRRFGRLDLVVAAAGILNGVAARPGSSASSSGRACSTSTSPASGTQSGARSLCCSGRTAEA
jgi:NAD(P)-dependent dehydrogenase (short-subunit alcohol dehydrogenase family)